MRAPVLFSILLAACSGEPQAPDLQITPSQPTTLDDLRLVIDPTDDREEIEYEIEWTRDGNSTDLSGQTDTAYPSWFTQVPSTRRTPRVLTAVEDSTGSRPPLPSAHPPSTGATSLLQLAVQGLTGMSMTLRGDTTGLHRCEPVLQLAERPCTRSGPLCFPEGTPSTRLRPPV